jgi:hypothetical protein
MIAGLPIWPLLAGPAIGFTVMAFRALVSVGQPACPTCGKRSRSASDGDAYYAGAVSGFASGSYAGARLARDVRAVQTGRVGNRIYNKAVGRLLVSRMYRR